MNERHDSKSIEVFTWRAGDSETLSQHALEASREDHGSKDFEGLHLPHSHIVT